MNRTDAINKVKKIIARAKGTDNANERDTAYAQAGKIMTAHNLKASDVHEDSYLAAYTDMVKAAKEFTDKNPPITSGILGTFNIIGELLSQSSEHMPAQYKTKIVKKLAEPGTRKMVVLVMGSQYAPLMVSIETILKNHNL
jgi:hypothetical protein